MYVYYRYVAPVLASIVFLIKISSELRRREMSSFSTTDRDKDIEKDIVSSNSLRQPSDNIPTNVKSFSSGENLAERYVHWIH